MTSTLDDQDTSAEQSPSPRAVADYMAEVNPVFQSLGMETIEVRRGYAEMALHVRPDLGNTYGVAHGGVVFSFADMCFGVAANAYNVRTVTAAAEIQYIRPGKIGETMSAVAKEIWRGTRSAVYDVTVNGADGETTALLRIRGRILGGSVIPPPGQDRPEPLG